eukprot:jgi/Tetstr1/427060/TSEL_017265.t1
MVRASALPPQDCFWGHWVDGEGVFPQHAKVAAVVKMPPPTDVARQRRFPSMVGYYGKFIEQVAVKRKPLIKLTGKVPGARLGVVLAQEDDEGREYVVEFANRTCQGAEPNYAGYEAWARRRVLDAAHEGAADDDLVAVTGELSAGPRRGDPWTDTEAMAVLQPGNVNMAQPYARYTWRGNILWYLHKDGTRCEVPPPSERDPVIMDVHDVKMGNFGRDRLRGVVAASYFWPGRVEDVARVEKA